MAKPAVFNASPLIFLARAGLSDLTPLAGEPVLVPRAVVEEIERFGLTDPAATFVRQAGWLGIVDPEPAPTIMSDGTLAVAKRRS